MKYPITESHTPLGKRGARGDFLNGPFFHDGLIGVSAGPATEVAPGVLDEGQRDRPRRLGA